MKIILAAILGAGFVFRLLFLGQRQLWTDEIMQAMILRAPSAAEMLVRLRDGMAVPAPLDYFIQKGFVLVLGESTWALRLHAVVLGTLSIWIFFRIGRRLFGERVAVYSSILFMLYPLHYHYSQEARPYALLVFLTLVSYELLLRIVAGGSGKLRNWLLLGLVLTLALYSSFLGLLVLLSQFAALVLSAARNGTRVTAVVAPCEKEAGEIPAARWAQVARYAVTAVLACALFIPWVRFAFARPLVAPAGEVADPKLALRMIKELGDNSYPMAGLLLLGAVAGIRALRLHKRERSLLWLLTWFALSIPAVIFLEVWAGYFFAIRHILHCTPALVLLAGYGASYVGESLRILDRLPYRVSAPAILYGFLTLVMSVWIAQSHWRKEPVDWRAATKFLQESVRPGDALSMPQVSAILEYFAPSLSDFRVQDLDPGPSSLSSGAYKRRYVVCFDPLTPDPCAGFREAASRDAAWRRQEFRGFTIFIREK